VLPYLSALENVRYLKALYECPGLLYFITKSKSDQMYLQAQIMKEKTDEKPEVNQMRTTITN